MTIEYDARADALYITLSEKAYSFGKELDASRRIDYAADGTPIGVELLFPSRGLDLHDLPLPPGIAAELSVDYKFAIRA